MNSDSGEVVLQFAGLNLRFPGASSSDAHVLRDINLDVRSGEILGIIGESGSGKTALALSTIGLLPDSASLTGSIMWRDRDITRLSQRELRALRGDRIAMIFQDPMTAFNPTLPVGRQVVEPHAVHRKVERSAVRELATDLLRGVKIADPGRRAGQRPHELSGGMLQRAMIASATALHPDVLIADEPTTGLDVTIQAGILNLFRSIRDESGTSIMLVTHDIAVVAEVCDRVAVMYGGEIVEVGRTADVVRRPCHPYTEALIAATPDPLQRSTGFKPIAGSMPSPDETSPGCRFAPRCEYEQVGCDTSQRLGSSPGGGAVRCHVRRRGVA
jgi:oligopeptide/dipeptide ABC transporter ATP-binding protein